MTPQEFAPLLAGIHRLQASHFAPAAALATLTRSWGPTFRRPGARMLIFGDGTVVRGLAGGCPEADIIERGARVITDDRPEIARYDASDVFDPMIETGCGGDIEVLIEPLTRPADVRFLDVVDRCLTKRESGVLATAFARDGKCLVPRPRRSVWTNDTTNDDLEDRKLSEAIQTRAATVSASLPLVERFPSEAGGFDVLIERLEPPHAVVLIGVTAVSRALARLALQLGWVTILVDPRQDRSAPADLPSGVRLVSAPPEVLVQRVRFDPQTSAVVMTHKLSLDVAYLSALRDAPVRYLGAVGSRSRADAMFEATRLSSARLRSPAGLDVGSETPEEIALAIAAEILAVATDHPGGALSDTDRPIH